MVKSLKKLLKAAYLYLLACKTYCLLIVFPPRCTQLEIGSGPNKRKGWLTLDICSGADYVWDLRNGLPFKNNTFQRVYSSHVLEHFSFKDLQLLLEEIHRVLKPGGEFLIAVPDVTIYINAYLGKRKADDLLYYKPAVPSDKPIDILNYIFYMDGHHRFMFDEVNLAYHCEAAGFVKCQKRTYDSGLDLASRDHESLYMSCVKLEN